MSRIAMQTLYNDALSEAGLPNNERSSQLFVRSTNACLDKFSEDIDRSSAYDHIASTDSLVKDLDDRNADDLYDGIAYYMVRRGGLNGDPRVIRQQIELLREEWASARNRHWTRYVNDCQINDSSDVIGLGSVDS